MINIFQPKPIKFGELSNLFNQSVVPIAQEATGDITEGEALLQQVQGDISSQREVLANPFTQDSNTQDQLIPNEGLEAIELQGQDALNDPILPKRQSEEGVSSDNELLSGEPLGARHTGNKNATNLTSFVKGFEGWNPNSYADGRQRSIGYGTRAKKGEKSISKAEGERRLARELSSHRSRVESLNRKKGYNFTQAQKDALTSFDYNTGRLEMLTANGSRSKSQIASKILQYNKADMKDGRGLRPLKGLTRRRNAESKLFTRGY